MTFLARKFSADYALIILLLIGSWFVYHNAFMQDDAYISYNYAKNFARGYGLVWYPNLTEFGFSNFFYTLMIGIAMKFGVSPEGASNTINIFSFFACLLITYSIGKQILSSKVLALFPVLMLATHHSFTAYATGGLETMFATVLVLGFYHQLLTPICERRMLWLGGCAAIAMLTRLDSVILLAPGYVYLWWVGGVTLKQKCVSLWSLRTAILLPVIATLGLLLHCYLTYGFALPNTFYIKMPGENSMAKFGLRYLWLYNKIQLYVPIALPLLLLYFYAGKGFFAKLGKPTILLASTLLIWLLYIIYVGGDFMEFRFLVPVLAFYYVVVVKLIDVLLPRYKKQWITIISCLLFFTNYVHATQFHSKKNVLDFNQYPENFGYAFVESTDTLHEWMDIKSYGWRYIGNGLDVLFHSENQKNPIKLAVGNAGIIPYYSDMIIFDVLGLNSRALISDTPDPNIHLTKRPGHTKIASTTLLKKEAVNINIAFPQVLCKKNDGYNWMYNIVESFPFNRHETILLPIGNQCFVIADYITKHPKVDELLDSGTIIRFADVAQKSNCPGWLCVYPKEPPPKKAEPEPINPPKKPVSVKAKPSLKPKIQ